MVKAKYGPEPVAKNLCEAMGDDGLCDKLIAGQPQTAIAREIGVSPATLCLWIAADPKRSARAREARIIAAGTYADKAELVLTDAADPFELAKARELASHYRWRASKASPKEFGDKIEIEQNTTVRDLTDEAIDARLAALDAKRKTDASSTDA